MNTFLERLKKERPLSNLACRLLNRFFKKNLTADPHALHLAQALAPQVIAFHFVDLDATFIFRFTRTGVQVLPEARSSRVTAKLSLPSHALYQLSSNLLQQPQVNFEGDVHVLPKLLVFFKTLPDYWLSLLPRAALKKMQATCARVTYEMPERFIIESAVTPTRAEWEQFTQSVYEVCLETERLAARIALLKGADQ